MSALQLIITSPLAAGRLNGGNLFSAGGNTLPAGVSANKKNYDAAISGMDAPSKKRPGRFAFFAGDEKKE